MRIEETHDLGQPDAIARVDGFLDELMRWQPPGGVVIRDARRDWDGNRMTFSFSAAKGFFGAAIRGVMEVTGDRVTVEADLPALVRGVLGEERIREVVSRDLRKVLDGHALRA
jgi:hypothetical protein